MCQIQSGTSFLSTKTDRQYDDGEQVTGSVQLLESVQEVTAFYRSQDLDFKNNDNDSS